jgi:hypothetical protein
MKSRKTRLYLLGICFAAVLWLGLQPLQHAIPTTFASSSSPSKHQLPIEEALGVPLQRASYNYRGALRSLQDVISSVPLDIRFNSGRLKRSHVLAKFELARIKHFPVAWRGIITLFVYSSTQQRRANHTEEVWLRVDLERDVTADETMDEKLALRKLNGDLACLQDDHNMSHSNWSHFLRRTPGPDGFFAMVVGPDVIPLTTWRSRPLDEEGEDDARVMRYTLSSTRPLLIPSYSPGGTASVSLSHKFTYVLQMQQHHYNYGAVHDRDVFGAPFRPFWVVGKPNGFGRASSIRLERQKLKVARLDSLGNLDLDLGGDAVATATVAITSDSVIEMSLSLTRTTTLTTSTTTPATHHDRVVVSTIPAGPPPLRALCSLSLLRRRDGFHHDNGVVAGRGHYVAVGARPPPTLSATVNVTQGDEASTWRPAERQVNNHRARMERAATFLDIRGWTVHKEHPIRGQQYVWEPDECDTMSFIDAVDESDTRHRGSAAGTSPLPHGSVLASCFARHRHKILFLGDSQVRTLFHTAVSMLTLRKAMEGKLSHGRFVVSSSEGLEGHSSNNVSSRFAETALLCREEDAGHPNVVRWTLCVHNDSRQPLCPPARLHTAALCNPSSFDDPISPPMLSIDADTNDATNASSFVEMMWDPLLLNLSYFSRTSYRHSRRRDKRRQEASGCDRHADRHSVQHSADDAAGIQPLYEVLAQEEDEDANSRLQAAMDEHEVYGPDAAFGVLNGTGVSPPSGVSFSGFQTLHRALLGPNCVDTIVIGFGGWFGLHFWTYDDVEAHLADLVDALSHIAAIRKGLSKKRLLVLVAGTPAWPTYVTWDGHRRNTNSRLGIITQMIRSALSPAVSSDAPRLPFDVLHLPYFEMSYPMSHLRFHAKDIHYDRSMVPYSMLEVIGSLLCADAS